MLRLVQIIVFSGFAIVPIEVMAELDISVKILKKENGTTKTIQQMRDECVQYCTNIVGVPRCEHAIFYYKVQPNPVCRVTSQVDAVPVAKGTYGIWSRSKSKWLKASDLGGECTGKLSNAVGKYKAQFGGITCTGGGNSLACTYNTKGKYSIRLKLAPNGKFVVGEWDHNNGAVGPVWFALNKKCELTNGKYGNKPGEYTSAWSVHGKY